MPSWAPFVRAADATLTDGEDGVESPSNFSAVLLPVATFDNNSAASASASEFASSSMLPERDFGAPPEPTDAPETDPARTLDALDAPSPSAPSVLPLRDGVLVMPLELAVFWMALASDGKSSSVMVGVMNALVLLVSSVATAAATGPFFLPRLEDIHSFVGHALTVCSGQSPGTIQGTRTHLSVSHWQLRRGFTTRTRTLYRSFFSSPLNIFVSHGMFSIVNCCYVWV